MNPITRTIFLSFFIFSSCTVKLHLPEGEPVPEQLARKCLQRLDNQYPGSFQLTQRILLTVSGKEYDFIGSLMMRGDGVFRAVAMGEMGGTFLDIQYDSGKVQINKNSGNMPVNPLISGVANDILHLFTFPWKTRQYESSLKGDRLYLRLDDAPEVATILIFEDGVLIGSEHYMNNRIVRKVHYSNYVKLDGSCYPVPQRIMLENVQWHYVLKIDLLNIKELAK